jgi:hypothetical protein
VINKDAEIAAIKIYKDAIIKGKQVKNLKN